MKRIGRFSGKYLFSPILITIAAAFVIAGILIGAIIGLIKISMLYGVDTMDIDLESKLGKTAKTVKFEEIMKE